KLQLQPFRPGYAKNARRALRVGGRKQMLTFKVLSGLLLYPTSELNQARAEMLAILEREGLVNESLIEGLRSLMDRRAVASPLDAEAEYVALFDCSRSLSLHLFEHIHGDSRERGAAMSDLIEQYR